MSKIWFEKQILGGSEFVTAGGCYLFMSAFEHNSKGTMTNQVFPVELKLPDRLHGHTRKSYLQGSRAEQLGENDFATEAETRFNTGGVPCQGWKMPPSPSRSLMLVELVHNIMKYFTVNKIKK